jgi:5-methylcytosine-specific restriction endonuclease McrA
MRRTVADSIHERASTQPAAYLLTYSDPKEATLNVWALPEPMLFNSLASLPEKKSGQEYTLQIFADKQRIEHDASSPDLSPFFRACEMSPDELLVLNNSREVDAIVNERREIEGGGKDNPGIKNLKATLVELQSRPQSPSELRTIQRVLETYERPSRITRYVKGVRGSNCQLCGQPGFLKRNGKRYCEVHHLFHLSKNPPPECLGPDYLVVLCATCHRRMHYANVGEPKREGNSWRVCVDDIEHQFEMS